MRWAWLRLQPTFYRGVVEHKIGISVLRKTVPQQHLGTEFLPWFVDLLEGRILFRLLFVKLERRVLGTLQQLRRIRVQFDALPDQAAQGCRILEIVFGHHVAIGFSCRCFKRGLVFLGQTVPGFLVDVKGIHGIALPPAGVIVVRCHLVETQLLVVVGSHPLRCINGSLFQGGVNVATGDLLRYRPQTGHDFAAEARNAHLQPLEVGTVLTSLRNQPPICTPVFPPGKLMMP